MGSEVAQRDKTAILSIPVHKGKPLKKGLMLNPLKLAE